MVFIYHHGKPQEIRVLCAEVGGSDWLENQNDDEAWNCLNNVSDVDLWQVRQTAKAKLINSIQDRAQQRWTQDAVTTQQVIAMGSLLIPMP